MQPPNLQAISDRLNERYFDNTIKIKGIKYVKFLTDLLNNGITFGMYLGAEHRIAINELLVDRELLTRWPWFLEPLVHHELCHAKLVGEAWKLKPGSIQQYTCADHGADFWDLMLLHPKAREFDEAKAMATRHIRIKFLASCQTMLQQRKKVMMKFVQRCAMETKIDQDQVIQEILQRIRKEANPWARFI